jgi:hypothetical protein
MKKSTFVFLSIIFLSISLNAQKKISTQEYINAYQSIAIEEMKRTGVPADITLAQGVLETESGNSVLVKKSNNHFGIKCKENWEGETVYHDDDALGECFRKYNKAEESYRDHSDFLRNRKYYQSLFSLDPTDYKSWAYGLKKAGYATNPNYAKILIKTIEDYNLNALSKSVVANLPIVETTKSTVNVSTENTDVAKSKTESVVISKPSAPQKFSANKFNDLKAVFVDAGTSLLAIATDFNIPLSNLLEYNDLNSDGMLEKKTWIYLEKKHKQGVEDVYITSSYESIYDVAQSKGVLLSSLMAFNHLQNATILRPKTLLLLQSDNADEDLQVNNEQKFHEVQPKEGLFSIAKKYNITIDELKKINHLETNELSIGQKLIISKK